MNSRIPPRFADASFQNFVAHTASQESAAQGVYEWIKKVPQGAMLALIGKQGTGKSHLFYSAVRVIDAAFDVMDPRDRVGKQKPFVAPWYALADELRYGRTDITEATTRHVEPSEVRSKLWERKVVMLDEVRKTSGTEFDDTELAKFACWAYDNRVAVLITTNTNPLSEVLGAAAASRFNQIVINGPDARQDEAA